MKFVAWGKIVVDKKTSDQTINILQTSVRRAKIDPIKNDRALRRISG